MHEAKSKKVMAMVENGESNKLQWAELMTEFTDLELPRMLNAISKLTPSRIDSIIDVCEKAKEESKNRTFDSLKYKMLELGVNPQEFSEFLSSKKTQPAKNKNSVIKRMSTKVRIEIEGVMKEEMEKPNPIPLPELRKKLVDLGYPVNQGNIYYLRDRVLKLIEADKEAIQEV